MTASARVASGASISVGSYVPSTTTPFVVPIVVTGAVGLTAWTFDLTFDATDLAINTRCDPFANPFCDLLTGPITRGTLFSADAFSLFVPGFIITNPVPPFDQTGRLLGVNGAWQAALPAPSGDGILAFVEFVTRPNGSGTSTITVQGQSTNAAPEPATWLLLASGLLLLGPARRRSHAEYAGPPEQHSSGRRG